MQTVQSNKPVPLSVAEDLFWRAEEESAGSCRVAILFRVEGCVEENYLTVALQRLQQRHPKLQVAIARGPDGRPRYEFHQPTPAIPFEILDCEEGETPWREEIRRLLNLHFPPAGPLAAITVLRCRSRARCELILTAHHAIADGLSAIMLMDNLLAEYADAEAYVKKEAVQPLPMVRSMRTKGLSGWLSRFRLLQRIVRMQREEKRSQLTPLPEVPGIPHQSQWVHWVFSRQESVALIRRCRKEQTSLASAMVAAVFCGLADCLPDQNARFKLNFPFDLREFVEGSGGPVTAQDLGCFATLMSEFFRVPQRQPLWDLAREVHAKVQFFTRHGGPAFYHNLAGSAVRLIDHLPRGVLSTSNTRSTMLATNYGVLNICDAYGSLRPIESTLTFKNDNVGPCLVLETLVLGQRLNVGFSADGLDPQFWEQLQTAVRKQIESGALAAEPLSKQGEPVAQGN